MTDTYDGVKDYEQLFRNAQNRTEQKRKMKQLMAKYGETEFDIEKNSTPTEYMEFVLAGGRDVLKMVQKENMIARLNSPYPQTPMPEAARGNPKYIVSKNDSLREREMYDEHQNALQLKLTENERKTLKKLMKKYGEHEEDIARYATLDEWHQYQALGGKIHLDNLRAQNIFERQQSSAPKTPKPTAADGNPDYAASNETSMIEKEVLDERDIWKKNKLLFERAKKHLASPDGEGSIDNIYLDTKGYITIGKGENVDDKKTFMALNLKNGNREATYAEKLVVYNKFLELKRKKEYGNKYGSDYYKKYSSLRITPQTMDELLESHLRNDISRLRKGIPEFDKLPIELMEVLVDIRYNSGAITEERWPNLRRGIRDKNLTAIANEINRKDVSQKRNDWAKERIKSITGWGYWED